MFHCPRCGTLVGCYADGSALVPALVARCREFGRALRHVARPPDERDWHRLGIDEAIATPAQRKEQP